ncbi:MAG: hypothetical protein WC269_01690 [Candidatus Gracilibacteria bacterium]|jgi:hypothetical protein
MKICKKCGCQFEVSNEDRDFYARMAVKLGGKTYDVPEPEECPHCRQQNRLAFYNRRILYKRNCDLTSKPIISIFSEDKPFIVYDRDVWYSDKWDPLKYGQDFDFNRLFFEQFNDLFHKVPMFSLMLIGKNENAEYNNDDADLKNCYLVFDGTKGQDSYYGESFYNVENCMDFLFMEDSSLCYETTNCTKCYNLKFSRYCKNCSDSWFLRDCTGCRNCAGCANLTQKQYCIFNEQHTKEEYEDFMAKFDSGSYQMLMDAYEHAKEFQLKQPVKATHGVQNENIIGDNLNYCKNAHYCFDSNYLQDCDYIQGSQKGAKDCQDIDVWGEKTELCYNCCESGTNLQRCMGCWGVSEGASSIYYSIFCSQNVHDLFGCVGLRHKKYCILNKQYSKEEYEKLVGKIIEHMKSTGEWGQFFPMEMSPFCYNETLAQLYYHLDKEEIEKNGYKWKEPEEKAPPKSERYDIPDNIKDADENICDKVLVCEATGAPYKIIPQELHFLKKFNLPIPHKCPEQRHKDRMKLRNMHKLWDRKCANCGANIKSSFHPDRKEIVYCEKCYLEETKS